MADDVMDRIRRRVVVDERGCWIWQGATSKGYGRITLGSRTDGSRHTTYTHRVTFHATRGEVPEGLVLDHACDNRLCCNPDHLRPMGRGENGMRTATSATAINRTKVSCPKCGGPQVWLPTQHCRGCPPCQRRRHTEWARARRKGAAHVG